MKNQIYKGSSLSMFITFILHCALKDTRASGSLFQYMLADPIRDHGLTVRCFFHYSFGRYSWTIDHLYLTVLSVDHPSCRPSIIHDGSTIVVHIIRLESWWLHCWCLYLSWCFILFVNYRISLSICY
jgi:hypothetical protein